MLDDATARAATDYNKAQGYSFAEIERVQEDVGAPIDGILGPDTSRAIAEWQASEGLTADGKLGPSSFPRMISEWWDERDATPEEQYNFVRETIQAETGGELYRSHNKDTEFKYSKYTYHVGSSLGLINFSQDSGNVGAYFQRAADIDRDGFDLIMIDSVEVLDITQRTGPRELRIEGDPGERRPCVMPIAGYDLWDDDGPWPDRIDRLAQTPAGKQAQVEIMHELFLVPAWAYACELGWMRQTDIAVIFDICVQMGTSYIKKTLWPLVWKDRPSDARCLLDHLMKKHRERRERVLDKTEWWITYERGDLEAMS